MKGILGILLLMITTLSWSSSPLAEDINHLDHSPSDLVALAQVLVQNGQNDKALNILLGLKERKLEALDRITYHVQLGLIYQQQGKLDLAYEHFEKSFKSGSTNKMIYLYMARISFELKHYDRANDNIDKSGPLAWNLQETHLLKSRILGAQKEYQKAWQVLQKASVQFHQHKNIEREKILVLMNLKLVYQALDLAQKFVHYKDLDEKEVVMVAHVFEQAQERSKAIKILEMTRLMWPQSQLIHQALASLYAQNKSYFSAAMVLDSYSFFKSDLMAETSELFRLAKRPEYAMYLSSKIGDKEKKLKQKLALYLEVGRYDQVVSLDSEIRSLDISSTNEELTYALAYSYFQTGQFKKSESLLTQVTKQELFEKGLLIRKAMESCIQTLKGCP